MTRNLKATLPVHDGAQIEVTVILREEDNGERSQGMERSVVGGA
jgi:hypothetical protein